MTSGYRTYDFRDFSHSEIYHGILAQFLSACSERFNVYHLKQIGMDGLRAYYWRIP